MFGEGQGFLATDKCSKAFSVGIGSLAVGILDMVLINFTIWDMLACAVIGSSIMYKIIPTSRKLFGSSSLVSYWRWGVGKDGEIGSRAIENEVSGRKGTIIESQSEKRRGGWFLGIWRAVIINLFDYCYPLL